ncbi:MAG TPA: GNAT family N-acetyltransferase [Candidatus Angelobacter sp.]|jgi:predicted N-acetyltransferase YhbS|nr:GNAT family N-acetyltransferase [Candidatus Angelobacter sp.]
MANDFLIREAAVSEAVVLAGLINRAFEVERFFLDGDRTNPEEVRELFAKGHFLVAENSTGLAGCVYVEKRSERAYMGLLSIELRLQRAGLGLRLTAAAEDFALSLGCEGMDLCIVSVRAELPAFYHRAGYVQTGTEKFPSDANPRIPCHFIVMSKALR